MEERLHLPEPPSRLTTVDAEEQGKGCRGKASDFCVQVCHARMLPLSVTGVNLAGG